MTLLCLRCHLIPHSLVFVFPPKAEQADLHACPSLLVTTERKNLNDLYDCVSIIIRKLHMHSKSGHIPTDHHFRLRSSMYLTYLLDHPED